jgi:hypothetical protein
MTPHDALIELVARLGARHGAVVLITDEELSRWPEAAVAAMKSQGLLAKARPASSVECPGCEQQCVMPVDTLPATSRGAASYVVCDKRSDINRVPVAASRLTQWRCDAEAVCSFIVASLGLRRSDQHPAVPGLLNIGMASGEKRRQMLCLKASGDVSVVAGNSAVSLSELIDYHDGAYSLDGAAIRQLVDTATTADPRYTPRTTRREARKLDTQAMYKGWQKAYRDLKKQRRKMSDVWYAQQIAKQNIGPRRSVDTIRKHMKK